jgi:hypothetical protein
VENTNVTIRPCKSYISTDAPTDSGENAWGVGQKVKALIISKPANGNGNVYREDHSALESLIPLAAMYGVAIAVVHHVRKMAADDPLDELNASTGLSGSVDSGLILKRGQGTADATLYVRGRDVEEQNLALRWDTQISGWRVVGDAADFAMSDIRQ